MWISVLISFVSVFVGALNINLGIAYVLIICIPPRSVRFLQFQRLIDFLKDLMNSRD